MSLCPACGSHLLPATKTCTACWHELPVAAPTHNSDPLRRPAAGLGIPNQRAAAFKPLQVATTPPPPSPYVAAERRIQAAYRCSAAERSLEG